MKALASGLVIRDGVETDLDSIVAIYNASIPGRLATADTEPITVESRRGWLRDRDRARHPLWVVERQGRVIGWLSVGPFYGRVAYAATCELGIYVDPVEQRAGAATALMQHALVQAGALGITTYLAFVFAHNERSVALCEKFGFAQWGRLPRVAVLDGVERDLLIMGLRMDLPGAA